MEWETEKNVRLDGDRDSSVRWLGARLRIARIVKFSMRELGIWGLCRSLRTNAGGVPMGPVSGPLNYYIIIIFAEEGWSRAGGDLRAGDGRDFVFVVLLFMIGFRWMDLSRWFLLLGTRIYYSVLCFGSRFDPKWHNPVHIRIRICISI